MKKKLFFMLGCLSLLLGTIGIFLPILPTTPFVLLSAFLFERSSEKFHRLLLENKIFGKYIKDYTEKKGITYKNKVIAIIVMTLGMGKGFLSMNNIYGRTALVIIFFAVLTHLLKLKTLKAE
ncbi:MAG: YbaN family protein [Cetobacterium sp.]|uniref:YbaN family protein n=1 Tax=unclassified Cetobacterium TaxID=2630983 RepID=UPI0006468727|nr:MULTISPECIES: YbaN family protein [unclassified Cetobacterium]